MSAPAHTIPPQAPTPESDPPISRRGLSWKAIASVASVVFALAGSTGTYLYTHAEERAEARAQHRETRAQLTRIEDDVHSILVRIARHDTRLATHDTRIAVITRDVDALERELAKVARRRRND